MLFSPNEPPTGVPTSQHNMVTSMLMPMVWSSLGVWVPRALRPFECLRAHVDLESLSWGNRGIAQFTYMRNCLEGMHKQALL